VEAVKGIIVVERLGEDHYRASCPLFPDCEAVATTEATARQAAAEAIGRIMRERLESLIAGALAERDKKDV
jgi:predicted RNase H-like HicB family nuclease